MTLSHLESRDVMGQFFWGISLITFAPFGLKLPRGVIFPGVIPAFITRGQGPSTPQFWCSLLFTPFDVDSIKFKVVTHTERGLFLGNQPRPCPKGAELHGSPVLVFSLFTPTPLNAERPHSSHLPQQYRALHTHACWRATETVTMVANLFYTKLRSKSSGFRCRLKLVSDDSEVTRRQAVPDSWRCGSEGTVANGRAACKRNNQRICHRWPQVPTWLDVCCTTKTFS